MEEETMIDVYSIIAGINKRKADSSITPSSALYSEIMNEVSRRVRDEINCLYKENKLTFHKTLNELSFDIVQQ